MKKTNMMHVFDVTNMRHQYAFVINRNSGGILKSVMHGDTYTESETYGTVIMTLKDGKMFRRGFTMTTTDSLQVDEMYCKDFPQYKSKTRIQVVRFRLYRITYTLFPLKKPVNGPVIMKSFKANYKLLAK